MSISFLELETTAGRQFVTQTLHIRLLGDFYLAYGNRPLTTVSTARLQVLLTYLVLHCHALQARSHLAFLFWPDSSEAQAKTNLRRQFHLLRQVLPESQRFLYADAKKLAVATRKQRDWTGPQFLVQYKCG